MRRESSFQSDLIKDIEDLLPGAIVLKTDPKYIQGMPDLVFFYRDRWGALECKRSEGEPHQPNQDYYISVMDEMSFAAFVYPENKEEILDAIQQSFRPTRSTRFSRRK